MAAALANFLRKVLMHGVKQSTLGDGTMDVDVIIESRVPQIHVVTPKEA